jgi:hypothetical protein
MIARRATMAGSVHVTVSARRFGSVGDAGWGGVAILTDEAKRPLDGAGANQPPVFHFVLSSVAAVCDFRRARVVSRMWSVSLCRVRYFSS